MPNGEVSPPEVNILNMNVVSLKRFVFAVRTISQNDLWDEVIEELAARGCHSIALSVEPVEAMKEALRQRMAYTTKEPNGNRNERGERRRDAPLREQPGESQEDPFDMSRPQRHLERFMASACGTPPRYPPRPPDEWPEGPWDPPQ
ncbi:hypothetical protein [Streptomyces qinglanensis]|uniref:Uncharacterized protein n=1 Tax=Streptomyces qinglanensis TaxID=943816 RepID=A0A1H9SCY4_9ACTN|nr:hypothetical protein [Streptomyces qinglanensis]SER82880.1 hypothetical protein SAMN05421870_104448 [Streptomyces qinglanensis]